MGERLQIYAADQREWTVVRISRGEWTARDSEWLFDAQQWCWESEQIGHWSVSVFAKYTVFRFSNPDTAFAFKMRWC